MTTDPIQHLRELHEHIAVYLGNGGLFNPEMMDHERVRDIMVDLNRALPALLAVADDMRELYTHDLGKTANSIVARALAKLDEVKHD